MYCTMCTAPHMHCQAGDVTKGDGSGGVSLFGPDFAPRLPELRHMRGTVSMVVGEGGAVRSQFFVAAMPMAPEIDREMREWWAVSD